MSQRFACRVTEVIPHGERVYTVLLRPSTRPPRFLAGQFLHLALDPFRPGDFWPDSRVFSIASSASQTDALRITYAVKGVFTTRMEAELEAGRNVWIKMPYGEFVVSRDRDVCLVAGGTGITAFTAFLSDLPVDHPHEVHVFYGARTRRLLIYRQVTEELAHRCANAHVHLFAEQLDGIDDGLLHGRLDIENLSMHLPCPSALTYYVAGPPAMIEALSDGILSLGAEPSQIVVDAWE